MTKKSTKKTKSKAKSKSKGGRPSKFNEQMTAQARKLCERGFTDVELAEFFDVTEKTITNWKKKHPEFLLSLKEAKEVADARVERALYERATGYVGKKTEVAKFQGSIGDVRVVDEYVGADVTACIFWLKNRQPEKWREKGGEKEETGDINVTVTVDPKWGGGGS